MKFDEDVAAFNQAQRDAAEARAQERERIRQEQEVLASGQKTMAALNGIMAGAAQDAPRKTDEQTSGELEELISRSKAAYDAAENADDRFEYGQQVAAGVALRCVLENEEAVLKSKPFRNALNSGKLNEVLELVKDSDAYKQNVGQYDLHGNGGLKEVTDNIAPQRTATALQKGLLAAMRDAQRKQLEQQKLRQIGAEAPQNAAGNNAPNSNMNEPPKNGPVLSGPQ